MLEKIPKYCPRCQAKFVALSNTLQCNECPLIHGDVWCRFRIDGPDYFSWVIKTEKYLIYQYPQYPFSIFNSLIIYTYIPKNNHYSHYSKDLKLNEFTPALYLLMSNEDINLFIDSLLIFS
jgi:hypothetical protein